MQEKLIPLAKGMIKHIPGVKELMGRKTGGTDQSRYCYTVWLRHLINYNRVRKGIPKKVAEIGPGDSLGISLAALVSGCEELHALDVIKYWDNKRNLQIFDELVELFRKKEKLPDSSEYPLVRPEMEDYSFPSYIISKEQLEKALAPERIAAIRAQVADINNPNNTYIRYNIPWYEPTIIRNESMDFVFSQAVFEHVEDLENTYSAMRKWLKPNGIISHAIDFKCHGTSKEWNGHWTYTDWEWSIIRGGKSFLINRRPLSAHLQLCEKHGFKVLHTDLAKKENHLRRDELAPSFAKLSDEDLTTSGLYVLAEKV